MLPVEAAMRELDRFETGDGPFLSVYLLTDPTTALGRNLHAQFEDMMRDLAARLDHDDVARQRLPQEADAVRSRLQSIGEPPRSLAVFSSTARTFLQELPLPVRVVPGAYWGARPYVRPLLAALDEDERTIVVLVDKEEARFFRVFLGQIAEIKDIEDVTPAKHRQVGGAWGYPPSPDWVRGGWPETGMVRHEEMHVHWHVRRMVDALTKLAGRERVDRILVGGTPEVIAEFSRLLPKGLRGRLAGEVRAPLYAPPSAVLTAVQAVKEEIERADEARLVADLLEQIGTGRAVTGPQAVVDAVRDGRVYALVFSGALSLAGARCLNCGNLILDESTANCPACGGALQPEPDLVETLALRVLAQDGRVEEVRGPAAERLSQYGGIVALVRYVG
jgi:peptide chain release factor subunit 1